MDMLLALRKLVGPAYLHLISMTKLSCSLFYGRIDITITKLEKYLAIDFHYRRISYLEDISKGFRDGVVVLSKDAAKHWIGSSSKFRNHLLGKL